MKLISAVFHPLLVATHVTLLLLYTAPELLPRVPEETAVQFVLIVFVLTGGMPAISIFLLKTFNYISDFELRKRGERLLPFLFIIVYYLLAIYLFMIKLQMGYLFNLVMVSVTILIMILLLITSLKFKISIHSAAIWSAVGYLTAISITQGLIVTTSYYGLVLCAGLTTSSRIYLGYHTPKESWTGVGLGFLYSFSVFYLLS